MLDSGTGLAREGLIAELELGVKANVARKLTLYAILTPSDRITWINDHELQR